MSDGRFEFGDRVRHAKRPEWGIGSVVKAETATSNGCGAQRISVRFPGVGVKVLNTAHASLQLVTEPSLGADIAVDEGNPVQVWGRIRDAEWLAPVAQRKIEEAMISLPSEVRDPFNGIGHRLAVTAGLYRFERSGAGLIAWAVAQTGLDDPLSRFSRHELEQYFDRWAQEREAHLHRLLQEAGADSSAVRQVLSKGPAGAREAARRITTVP